MHAYLRRRFEGRHPCRLHMTLLLPALLLIGCKAGPAMDTGFISQPESMTKATKRTPFHRSWVNPDWYQDRKHYEAIHIAPVNTDYMMASDWWRQRNARTEKGLKDGLEKISVHMHEQFELAITDDPDQRFKAIQIQDLKTQAGKSLMLEVALVELSPAKAYFNAAGTISGFIFPLTRVITSATGKGTIAMEARVIDSKTQKVYMRMADREKDKSAPINLAAMSWHQGSKRNIEDWAKQFVKLLKADEADKIKDSLAFTLSPW